MMEGPSRLPPSCLPSETFAHFQAREQQLLSIDAELDKKKDCALLAAEKASTATFEFTHRPVPPKSTPASSSTAPVPPPGGLLSGGSVIPPSPNGARVNERAHVAFQSGGENEAMHATVRFQKARIIALQEELDKTITLLNERDKEKNRLDTENKSLNEENRRLQRSQHNADVTIEKIRTQLNNVQNKCTETEKSERDLTKEVEELSQKCKKIESDHKTKDAKLIKVTEDMEKYRSSAKELKHAENDRRSGDKKETDRLLHEVRKLERQRTELLSGFKKQAQLIDVLKKQKTHLEAARLLSFSEEDYIRVLDLGNRIDS